MNPNIPSIPNPLSPRDRIINIATRLLILALTIILWLSIIQSCSDALGAPNAPHQSRFGKVDLRDRGHAFLQSEFLKTIIYSQDGIEAKLIPGSRRANIMLNTKLNLFMTATRCAIYHNTNYNTHIHKSKGIEYSVRSYPQVIHIIQSQAWKTSPSQEIFSFWDRSADRQLAGEVPALLQARHILAYPII